MAKVAMLDSAVSARVWQPEGARFWAWEIVTERTIIQGGGYDTALAAARSLVQELRRHAAEF